VKEEAGYFKWNEDSEEPDESEDSEETKPSSLHSSESSASSESSESINPFNTGTHPGARYTDPPMSLYRKYRPQAFIDVVGQEHVVTTLENAVKQDKLTHAYLFAGSRGTGKTSVARILAKHLLTRGIEDETLRRQIEESVAEGSIVDLIEIDGASNRRIEDSRELVEKIQFSPVVTHAKVYIIDEVHMLTKEAFNALLKTLEEPPSYAYFILATTELQKIPSTIQSRCQRFAFRQIREEDIVRRLQFIADQEHITVDRAALRIIARHAAGGMRDAISLLDQLRSLEKITAADVAVRIGESGQEHIDAIFAALESGDREEILRVVREVEEAGASLDTFLRLLLGEVRTRLHAAIGQNLPTGTMSRMLDTFLSALRDIRIAPVPGLVLESALLSLCEGDVPAIEKKAVKPLKKVKEKDKDEAAPLSEAKKKDKDDTPERVERAKEKTIDALVEAPELTLDHVFAVWPEIIAKASPPSVKMSLKNGRVIGIDGKTLTLSFVAKFHRDRVAQQESSRALEQLLQDHFKRPIRLECVVEEERGTVPIADAGMVDLAEAVSEIF